MKQSWILVLLAIGMMACSTQNEPDDTTNQPGDTTTVSPGDTTIATVDTIAISWSGTNVTVTDDHANASIPVSHGAGRLYEITGDEKWMRRMEAFWKTAVTDRGMFSTTGSNAGEFWIPPHIQGNWFV